MGFNFRINFLFIDGYIIVQKDFVYFKVVYLVKIDEFGFRWIIWLEYRREIRFDEFG